MGAGHPGLGHLGYCRQASRRPGRRGDRGGQGSRDQPAGPIGAHIRAGSGPASVFVKAPGRPLHRLALLALGAVGAEARLAASGAPLPVEHPLPYAAGVDVRRLAAVVVMDDVTSSGGIPNDATVGLAPAEVLSGLEGLARLHAEYWDRPLPRSLGFVRPWRLGRARAPVSAADLERAVRRLERIGLGNVLPGSQGAVHWSSSSVAACYSPPPGRSHSCTATLIRATPTASPAVRPGSTTGNCSDAATGPMTSATSWPGASTSRTAGRTSMGFSGPTCSRCGRRGSTPRIDDAWRRYRATPAFGLGTWMHTLAAGSFQSADVSVAMVTRFAHAYRDLDTARSLVAHARKQSWSPAA